VFLFDADMILGKASLVDVAVQGLEPGSLFLTAVATICGAIAAHVKAASANDAIVLEASRRADAAFRLLESLAGATFPEGHPSLARVVRVLNDLEERARKWCESSKWSRRLALSRSGTSKACKYRECFQQLFALLDRALQELMDAVQVESFSNLSELRAEFRMEADKLIQDFSAAAAAAGEPAASQAEVLKVLGDKEGASLEDLLAASRTQANALVEMESRLDRTLEDLKADLTAGRQAAQAAAKAAAAVAEAMQEHGNGGNGRGAADNTDEIVAALQENILNHVVPDLLNVLVSEGKVTRAAMTEAKDAVLGEVRGTQRAILERLDRFEALSHSCGVDMAKVYRYEPYDSDDSDQEEASLGEGTFGKTYRMMNTNDKVIYAIKLINLKSAKLGREQTKKESKVLGRLYHPNIVRYYGCFYYGKRDKYWAIAMAYLSGGSLLDKMESSPKPTPKQSLRWVLEIASALAHMHEKQVQHRDLKPDNVLFASEAPDAPAVIIDLGLASLNLAKSTASTAVGAMLYRSPEKALGDPYGPPDDVWSLGLITGGLALGQPLEDWVAANGGGGGLFALNRPKVKAFIAEAILSCASLGRLAAALLVEDAKSRPTAAAVVNSKGKTAALARPSVTVDAIAEEEDEDEAGDGSNKSEQETSAARLREAEARALAAEAEIQRMREVKMYTRIPAPLSVHLVDSLFWGGYLGSAKSRRQGRCRR